MIYLIFAILCSSAIDLLFKYSERIGAKIYTVTCSNYLIAFLTSIIMIIYKQNYDVTKGNLSFISEFSRAISSADYIMSPYSSIIFGLILGPVAGIFFFSSFIYYQKSVKVNGVSLSGTFSKLGVLVPMILSIVLWNEIPTLIQAAGIAVTVVAIIIVNRSSDKESELSVNRSLMALFFLGGMVEFSNKIYQKYAMIEYKEVFLFMVFVSAFIISLGFLIREKTRIELRDVAVGFAVGIPNLFTSYFLIMALDTIKASVAFPVFSAGTILIITAAGSVIFREQIAPKNRIAIVLVITAIILMNMQL